MLETVLPKPKLTTRQVIEEVIEGKEKAGSIMTIVGVAKEVGITGPAIHNRYPDLAKRISDSAGRVKEQDVKIQLEKRRGRISEEKAKTDRIRKELAETKDLLRKSDSVNAALVFDNDHLKAMNRKYLVEINRMKGPTVNNLFNSKPVRSSEKYVPPSEG
jgi:hypothetical protein